MGRDENDRYATSVRLELCLQFNADSGNPMSARISSMRNSDLLQAEAGVDNPFDNAVLLETVYAAVEDYAKTSRLRNSNQ